MRVPRSWLAEFVDIPSSATLQDIADAYVRIGIEPETTEVIGADLVGPIVVGKVLEFVEEPQSNGKTIRWCQVEIAPGKINGIVCGARNFFVDDKVIVVLPGAVLPWDRRMMGTTAMALSNSGNSTRRRVAAAADPAGSPMLSQASVFQAALSAVLEAL